LQRRVCGQAVADAIGRKEQIFGADEQVPDGGKATKKRETGNEG
jgi:hypothetical protein